MKIRKLLLLYKTSSYKHSFRHSRLNAQALLRFRKTHQHHYQALASVENVLKSMNVKYHKTARGRKINYAAFDFVITVGGDGTFLEASRNAKNQIILGVNSDPQWSVGRFCTATARTFPKLFKEVFSGKIPVLSLQRLRLQVDQQPLKIEAINDILVCHKNPAATSHYYLTIGRITEEQRSSGIWISSAAGSSGAIHSAGGQVLALSSRNFQYLPREIYYGPGQSYRLTGSILAPAKKIKIVSLMKDGCVFIDGAHVQFPLSFGKQLEISHSAQPLRIIYSN